MVGGEIHNLEGSSVTLSSNLPAALKCPILVMQEPINTSSILVLATSDKGFMSSGSFGQASKGSVISLRSISSTAAYSASSSASINTGFSSQDSIACALLSRVFSSSYPSEISHLRRMILDSRYSLIGSSFNLIVQPDADLSAEASDNSKACSTLRSGSPSISRHFPEKTFTLPSLGKVSWPV